MANLSHLPAQWRASGLSQRAFCKQSNISLATFSYWRAKELRAQRLEAPQASASASHGAASSDARPPSFTEVLVERSGAPAGVQPPSAHPAIEVTFPDGTRVTIPVPAARR